MQPIAYTDTDVATGGVVRVMELPPNAVVMRAELVTDAAFDAGITATIIRKKETDDTTIETMFSAVSVAATGVDSYTFTGIMPAESSYLTVDMSAAVTQGSARLIVEYIVLDRACNTYQ